jgi:hypothetical protein
MVIAQDSIPISGHHSTAHAGFDYFKLFEVQDHVGGLQVNGFDSLAHSHGFVNFAVRFFVIG